MTAIAADRLRGAGKAKLAEIDDGLIDGDPFLIVEERRAGIRPVP